MPEVLNGVATFLCCVTPIWRWHFCFIKLLLVDSFGLRLYHRHCSSAPLTFPQGNPHVGKGTKTHCIELFQFGVASKVFVEDAQLPYPCHERPLLKSSRTYQDCIYILFGTCFLSLFHLRLVTMNKIYWNAPCCRGSKNIFWIEAAAFNGRGTVIPSETSFICGIANV